MWGKWVVNNNNKYLPQTLLRCSATRLEYTHKVVLTSYFLHTVSVNLRHQVLTRTDFTPLLSYTDFYYLHESSIYKCGIVRWTKNNTLLTFDPQLLLFVGASSPRST